MKERMSYRLILVTGATGLVGHHVVQRATLEGQAVRVLVREPGRAREFEARGVEAVTGDLGDPLSLSQAVQGVDAIVHCAAKVGDWGPVADYRKVNVEGLKGLLDAALSEGSLKRFVHVSSLGVYPARDHYGTDESETPDPDGIDGYTLSKFEAERLVLDYIREKSLQGVVLRPGFIYGPYDRTVLPKLLDRIHSGVFAYLGGKDKLMNNTYVLNLVEAIFLALHRDDAVGEVFNIRDGRSVSKGEFVETICRESGYALPKRVVPLGVARFLATAMEGAARLLRKRQAPLLSKARIKFLGLNLDFSIEKAKRQLGYEPKFDFTEAMRETIQWFRENDLLPGQTAKSKESPVR
jgi:nucleoside-diphosphate-sugar epimerase